MIVRINQISIEHAEQEAGWASKGMMGPLAYPWPADARVFEFLILDVDEQKQPLGEAFRQRQLRMALPHAITALREPGEEVVIRLDGPLATGELLPVFRHLTESDLTGRFAVSELRKLDPAPVEVMASVRVHPSPRKCMEICQDDELGLARSVRLRVFCVPGEMVNPLLDINETDDERWREILPSAGFTMSTARGLRAIQLTTRRLGAADVKQRVMASLLKASQGTAG